jgi:hypothetical protein
LRCGTTSFILQLLNHPAATGHTGYSARYFIDTSHFRTADRDETALKNKLEMGAAAANAMITVG